jgi:YfiH family protein
MADRPAWPSDWLVPDWSVDDRVRAFVTTRAGGVSSGAHASLDLGGGASGGDARAVAENRRRVTQHLPAPAAWLQQVHGAHVLRVHAAPATVASQTQESEALPVADAAVTDVPGVPLAVRVADCLPVFLAARDGSAVGVAHAGWRGLAAGVLERTLHALGRTPADTVAWIGPGIGPQAFEVGKDVLDAFIGEDADAAAHFRPIRAGKWLADLPALARRRLMAAGVTEVRGGNWCTVHDPARFFSYRRDGATGRMAAVIFIDAKDAR